MKENRRRQERIRIEVEIRLFAEDGHELAVKSRDISAEGCFVEIVGEPLPAVGSILKAQTTIMMAADEEPPVRRVEVLRHEAHGMAIKFLD